MESDRGGQSLGAYLRAARDRAGLSVREAARLGDISHGYLTKLENDQQDNPSADVLLRLAGVYELDPGEVLAYIGIEPSSVLPPMEVLFRKQYGLTEAEAKEAADLIEERYGKRKETNT
jgi:transcriptional regulator with XRE-family HTH domain